MERAAVTSSNIASVGYDIDTMTLEIEFNSGGVYQYHGVDFNIYENMMDADSVGRYFHQHVRDQFVTDKVN